MRIQGRMRVAGALALTAVIAAACGEDATAPEEAGGEALLLSVVPTPGSTGISVGATVEVTFDHALASGMEAYAALHEGDVTGPVVAGVWSMSEDRRALQFAPEAPLKPSTTYTIHIGAGMMDEQGNHVNLESRGMDMGGMWVTGSMMQGGTGMGQGMGGMQGTMMGDGWAHPTNGTYGMVFTFTTGA